ncbi:hypothetical protein GJW-30_1_03830 [Variibacter gotjawalensis]|uniref:Glycosyltransferase RgtA/B/C/D-like domain-containing protein n=1 Tax=Variibacter gotjawalensis TaxID=1333996 RepID=A0A0S3PZA7_9BRAD|nr:glycosyltransferase family 39 protein [Variibacter gotjawalensis]NIK47111.1 hypothetical protein [Variibacter gotjawalensis]RZS49013.1 dolichyl-phosphate-mannose-protein mannosyltransferase [Variibacter gotjawalensis]BAT61273.1 hypothetical protein GJW-30_1_03830 [Variibacter gotjawalensis]
MSSRSFASSRVCDGLAALALLASGLIALITFRHYGLGWDDFTHAEMGQKVIDLYASGFRNQEALTFVNLYMYGSGFDVLAGLSAKVLPFDLFETRRLVGALVGIVGLFTVWRIARRVGGPVAGVVAIFVLATCPIFYGHAFINAKDVPFAVAMAILLLGLVRAIEEYPRPSPVTVMIFGVGLGLTIGTRIMGGIAALYAAAAVMLIIGLEWRSLGWRDAVSRFGRFTLALLPGFVVAYLIMGLLWPWSVVEVLNPVKALTYFSVFFEKPWREVFNGQLISVPDMPWTYLPTLLGLQLPEIMLALTLFGLVMVCVWLLTGNRSIRERAVLLLVAAAVIVPIAVTLLERPAMYNGFRHLIFLLPPMAILAGLAGGWILQQAARAGRPALATVAAVGVIGFASPVVEMVRLHPYEYTHFNRIEGGVKAADGNFMLDYWGLSLKQAAQQLRENLTARAETPPNGRKWKVAVCGPHPIVRVELGSEFELTWNPHDADFALMLGTYYCAQFRAPIIAKVDRAGVTYAKAYDVREHAYTTLFTIPPIQ